MSDELIPYERFTKKHLIRICKKKHKDCYRLIGQKIELKRQLDFMERACDGAAEMYDDLKTARKIIGNLYAICKDNHYLDGSVLMEQAEQFLKGHKYEKPMHLYRQQDIIDAIAYAVYYTANPESKMCVPNCAFIHAEKMFYKWFNDTMVKKVCKKYCAADKTCSIQSLKCSDPYDKTCVRFEE